MEDLDVTMERLPTGQDPLGDRLGRATSCRAAAGATLRSLLSRPGGRAGSLLLHGERITSGPGPLPAREDADVHELGHGWSAWTWPVAGDAGCRAADTADVAAGRVVVDLHERLAAARAEADALARRSQQLEIVLQIQRLVGHGAGRATVLEALVAGAMRLLDSDAASVHERIPDDPEHLTMVAAVGVIRDVAADFARVHVDRGVSGRVVRTGEVVVTHRYAAEEDARRRLVEMGIGGVLGAPVHLDGRVTAALVVSTRDPRRIYTPDDEELLAAFVAQAELAFRDAHVAAERDEALRDALTGLPRRRLLLDRLGLALEARARTEDEVGVLFVDLDRFKPVNDRLGHAAGDAVLREVAARMAATVRPGDTLARFGGDEFALLVVSPDEAQLGGIAERLAATFRKPFVVDGHEVRIGASIGVASSGTGPVAADELVAAADAAMYAAKRTPGGGARWCSATR